MFVHDPDVVQTRYRNGVDLARVAGVVMMEQYRHIEYDTIDLYSALEGDDYVRIFFNSVENATIADFVYRFFELIDGDIYISETCHHVFVKGRLGSDEERKEFIDDLKNRFKD